MYWQTASRGECSHGRGAGQAHRWNSGRCGRSSRRDIGAIQGIRPVRQYGQVIARGVGARDGRGPRSAANAGLEPIKVPIIVTAPEDAHAAFVRIDEDEEVRRAAHALGTQHHIRLPRETRSR